MKSIESIDDWRTYSERLLKNGYAIWQMQYDTQSTEGFHVWFSKSGKKDFEIVTHNDKIHDAIIADFKLR